METFTLFNSFPPEIHSMILETCEQNDAVCLRLSCKYLYTLPPPSTPTPLSNSSIPTLCTHPEINSSSTWHKRYAHRQECHRISHEMYVQMLCSKGEPEPELRPCKTQRWSLHCECFSRKGRLHWRLASWMPAALKYCGECERFTRRKKSHNGRCYHGRSKPPTRNETFWTHRSRKGAFGHKLWKKWFNNRAMNHYESRLRLPRVRKGLKRYDLRTVVLIDVDTRLDRDCL